MQSRDEASPSRIELVVLACLAQSKPPSDAELGDTLHLLALPRESAAVARQRAVEVLARLVRRAWVTGEDEPVRRNRQGKVRPPRTLTDAGARVLRDAFQLSRAPTWAEVRDKHLPALGLGAAAAADLAGRPLTETALTAAVLGARFGVRHAATPMAVCDALICAALGMPAGKLTLDRIRAHVLLRAIDAPPPDGPAPGCKGYTAKLAASIAYSTVGATGTSRKMARALARRWVCGDAHPQVPGEPPRPVLVPAPPPPVAPPAAAANLLEVVRQVIPRIGAEGRFGEKVYVSAIWRSLERDRATSELSLDHFKHWLVSANRNGWLVLARADLIGAMDAKQVNDSEIHDRGATFHFVLDQPTTASVSQRESHAG